MAYDLNKPIKLKHLKAAVQYIKTKFLTIADCGQAIRDEVTYRCITEGILKWGGSSPTIPEEIVWSDDFDSVGKVFLITETFVTTENFVGGAGIGYPPLTNVVVRAVPGASGDREIKFDIFSKPF